MRLINRPSPNYDSRGGRGVDMLLLHYTGMPSTREALTRLTDPAAKVSAHYLIDDDGTVYRLVPEIKRAWHAGEAHWAGETDINACSIGVELANPGHEFDYRPFAQAQMAALVSLAREIVARHRIQPSRVLGHSDVAPGRKSDPGELFDWQQLARAGIGLWPGRVRPLPVGLSTGDKGPEVNALRRTLSRIGYGLATKGTYDDDIREVVTAFQRHFRPAKIDGMADGETRALADRLKEQVVRAQQPV